jgi:hypothetical protein
MKNILTIIALCVISFGGLSQVPKGINYQGSLRDNAGFTIAGKQIALRLSIVKDSSNGISEYIERHSVTTSNLGLFDVVIGTGTVLSGNFFLIDWGTSKKFLRIEIDTANGNSFVFMGATQFLSVPYALRSGKAAEADKLSNDSLGGLVPQGGSILLNTPNSPVGYSLVSEIQLPYSFQNINSDTTFSLTPEMITYGDSILIKNGNVYSYYDVNANKFFLLGNPRRHFSKNSFTLVNNKLFYMALYDTIFEYYPPTNTWTAKGFLGGLVPTGGSYLGQNTLSTAILGNSIFMTFSYDIGTDHYSKVIQYNYLTNQVLDMGAVNNCNNMACSGSFSKLFSFQNKLFLFYQSYPGNCLIAQYNTSSSTFNNLTVFGSMVLWQTTVDINGVYNFSPGYSYSTFFNGLNVSNSAYVSGSFLFSIGPLGVYWSNNPNYLGYVTDVRRSNIPVLLGTLDQNMNPKPGWVVCNGAIYFIGTSNLKLNKFIPPKTFYMHQKN